MTKTELDKLILDTTNKVLADNSENIANRIRDLLVEEDKGSFAGLPDSLGFTVALCLSVAPSISAVVTGHLLAELGFITLEET